MLQLPGHQSGEVVRHVAALARAAGVDALAVQYGGQDDARGLERLWRTGVQQLADLGEILVEALFQAVENVAHACRVRAVVAKWLRAVMMSRADLP